VHRFDSCKMTIEACRLLLVAVYPFAALAGFSTPFYASRSTPFDPTASESFEQTTRRYAVHYADSTELRGFVAKDEVYLYNLHVKARFGCITSCNSPDFNGVDGIMGFGIPDSSNLNGLPEPLFKAISMGPSDPQSKMAPGILRRRVFSFLVTDGAAEVQLGGHDSDAISGPMVKLETVGDHFYAVRVRGLKYGDQELLHFSTSRGCIGCVGDWKFIEGVVDSGTSCLVIPDSDMDGILDTSHPRVSAYQAFINAKMSGQDKKSFYIDMDGHTIEIPHSVWFLADSNQTCVQKTPANFPGILIGDVLFRKYLVEFDMTQEGSPALGLAPLNPNYIPTTRPSAGKFTMLKNSPSSTKIPAIQNNGRRLGMLARTEGLTRLPVRDKHETQFFINVSVGTPPQKRLVIFDTGSSIFGLFSKAPLGYKHAANFGRAKASSFYENVERALEKKAVLPNQQLKVVSTGRTSPLLGEGMPQVGSAELMGGLRKSMATQTGRMLSVAGRAVKPYIKVRRRAIRERARRKKLFGPQFER